MRSERLALLLFAAGTLCVAVPADLRAQADGVFAENRERILDEGVRECAGFRFGVASAMPKAGTAASIEAARERAVLLASADLLNRCSLSEIVFPDALSEKSRRELKDFFFADLKVSVSGLRTLCVETLPDGSRRAVVALPEAEAGKIPRLSYEDFTRELSREERVFAPSAPTEALAEMFALRTPELSPIDRAPWQAELRAADFGSPRLDSLRAFAGKCALLNALSPEADADYRRGMEAYRRGRLEEACAFFFSAAEKSWTFEILNMAGNAARRIGKTDEAVPLLLQAAYLNPKLPFPWVHLAFIAEGGGDPALAEACRAKAEAAAALTPDPWSAKQLEILRGKITGSRENP